MKRIILTALAAVLFAGISFAQTKKDKDVREKPRTEKSFKKKDFSQDGKTKFHKDGKRDKQAKKFSHKRGKFSAADKRKFYAQKKHDRYKGFEYRKKAHRRIV